MGGPKHIFLLWPQKLTSENICVVGMIFVYRFFWDDLFLGFYPARV